MASNLTHEDFQEIQRVCDERYVLQSSCNEKQEQVNKKFANDDKRIDLMASDIRQMRMETKSGLKFNNWLTTAVLGAIIAAVIAFYFLAT